MIVASTARALITGRTPGMPMQTGQTWVFGLVAAVVGGAAAEHLGPGEQLGVHFQADDDFVRGVEL